MRVLIILSADSQAGVVPEFDGLIEAYYLFRDAGMDVVVAAPGGGSASESPMTSAGGDRPATAQAIRRFKADRDARDVMNDLVDLASVCAGDFDGAICLGLQGHNNNARIKDYAGVLVARLLAAVKPVAVIAPAHADVRPEAGNSVVIIGNSNEAPGLAAHSLLGAMRAGRLADRCRRPRR
jgi:hypothetical protein